MMATADVPVTRHTHFDEAGPPASPAIVLLHGSIVTRTLWLPQLRALGDVSRAGT